MYGTLTLWGWNVPTIYWDQFTWEAFATLVAGGAAVAGAVVVANRQHGLAERQTEILARQAELSTLAIRADLFDRRMKVYETTREFLSKIVLHGTPPDDPAEIAFNGARRDARLLFSKTLFDDLTAIRSLVNSYTAAFNVMMGAPDVTANVDREAALRAEIVTWRERLAELFDREMGLGSLG